VTLKLAVGEERDVDQAVRALASAGFAIRPVVEKAWPEHLELVVTDEFDAGQVIGALDVLRSVLCPAEVAIALRVSRESWENDLLYYIPCSDWNRAVSSLPQDVAMYRDDRDGFRNWFRGQWIGSDEERVLTIEELSSEPLTAAKILAVIDPIEWRDWRDVQNYLERHAPCAVVAEAMGLAQTTTQKDSLAYLFHRRHRPCLAAIPHLVRWLKDESPDVRLESADSLGQLISLVRSPVRRRELGDLAGRSLLEYVQAYPEDNLFWAHIALGVTGYEPARPYLEEVAQASSGNRRESAEIGLENLNRFGARAR
jgi:HEAT repeat